MFLHTFPVRFFWVKMKKVSYLIVISMNKDNYPELFFRMEYSHGNKCNVKKNVSMGN
jgi:hypothetical protein